MQTQDAAGDILFKLWPWLEANKNRLIGGVVAVIVISGVAYSVSAARQQKQVDAGQALTAAILSPEAKDSAQIATELQELATKYSGTPAAQRAEVQAAAALYDDGKYPDALAVFQKFLDANPSGPYSATAELGIGACLEAQDKLDQAAAAYQRVVSIFPTAPCVAQAELSLGRIAEEQKQPTEALKHFQNAARSTPGSTIAREATMRAADLQNKMATAAKAAPAIKPTVSEQPTAKH